MRISDWRSSVCASDRRAQGCVPVGTGARGGEIVGQRQIVEEQRDTAIEGRELRLQASVREQPRFEIERLADPGIADPGGGIGEQHTPRLGHDRIERAPHRVALGDAQIGARGSVDAGDDEIRSEEHTSELQSLMRISYAVFCLKKKQQKKTTKKPEDTDKTKG